MTIFPPVVAGLVYFALGGIWFSPLFGKQWDKAVGFARPEKWRPAAVYYLGPLSGCVVTSFATAFLFDLIQPASLLQALKLGFLVGTGYGASITGINAISPNMPKPGLYAAVVGAYHLTGLLLVAAVLFGLS